MPKKTNQQGNVINASAFDGGDTGLDPETEDGLHRNEEQDKMEEEVMLAGKARSPELDKMEDEISAAEDNLLMWQERYEMEVRREAVSAQVDAKMALDAAEQKFKELTAQYKPEHLLRPDTLPVPPKFVPPLPIITEEIKKEIQPKVTRSKKKKKKK